MKLLNKSSLAEATEALVVQNPLRTTPQYRIVHLGIGNFHRAHQAVFTEHANGYGDIGWSIVGVSFNSSRVRDALFEQDYLYTVSERDTSGQNYQLISCLEKVLLLPEDPGAVFESIADPATQVVTITVTEKGYCQKSGVLDTNHESIQQELNGGSVSTMPGALLQGLKLRMEQGHGALTVISCDNLPSNGSVLERVVLEYAELLCSDLKSWIQDNVSFCSTMVDRIVPASTPEGNEEISNKIGLLDNGAVLCEPFKQWVIERKFATPIPAWDEAGATFTDDVESFEKLKLRVLNGCHSLIAYSGILLRDTYIHETVSRPQIRALVKAIMIHEMARSLVVPEGVDVEGYCSLILSRFENKYVPYLNSQVGTDGTLKLPQRILAPISDLLDRSIEPRLTALTLGIWVLAMRVAVNDSDSKVKDPNLEALTSIYQDANTGIPVKALLALLFSSEFAPGRQEQIEQRVSEYCAGLSEKGLIGYLESIGYK